MVISVKNCLLSFYLDFETAYFILILVLVFSTSAFSWLLPFMKVIIIRLSTLNQKIIRSGTKLSDGRFLLYLYFT